MDHQAGDLLRRLDLREVEFAYHLPHIISVDGLPDSWPEAAMGAVGDLIDVQEGLPGGFAVAVLLLSCPSHASLPTVPRRPARSCRQFPRRKDPG